MKTNVEMKCVAKKQSLHYDGKTVQHEIELEVPYDPTSVYFKLSGGTNIVLKTINQDAANGFDLGQKYMLSIDPVAVEAPAAAK